MPVQQKAHDYREPTPPRKARHNSKHLLQKTPYCPVCWRNLTPERCSNSDNGDPYCTSCWVWRPIIIRKCDLPAAEEIIERVRKVRFFIPEFQDVEKAPGSKKADGDRCADIAFPWKKVELIGQGSFGIVHKAIDSEGTCFAAKRMEVDDLAQFKLLQHQIDFLKRCHHKHIIKYMGSFSSLDMRSFYIFEELALRSLEAEYQRERLSDREIQRYTRQMLEGLEYLHAKYIVHGNLKCNNILIAGKSKICKLDDFGLAKNKLFQFSTTPPINWLPPEVCCSRDRMRASSFPSDIWSLGCTVLEMATAERPWGRMSRERIAKRLENKQVPHVPKSISKNVRKFIKACLEPRPSKRPTAKQLLDDLDKEFFVGF